MVLPIRQQAVKALSLRFFQKWPFQSVINFFENGHCTFSYDKQNAREIPKVMSWLQCMLAGISSPVFLVMHVT